MMEINPAAILQSLYGEVTQGGTVNTLALIWCSMAILKLQAQMASMTQTLSAFMTIFGKSHAGQPEVMHAGDD